MTNQELWEKVGEAVSEFRQIREWLKRICKEFDEHISDHKESIKKAEEAKQTANQAAMMTAIQHRSNRIAFWAPIVASLLLVATDIILRALGR